MYVYVVWHVSHAEYLDGRSTDHFDAYGDLRINEQDGDDVKILGVYSDADGAQGRIERARSEPGFKNEPDCFIVDKYTVGKDLWSEGFVTVESEPTQTWSTHLWSRLRTGRAQR